MSEERFARIEGQLDGLRRGQDELRRDVGELKADVRGMKGDISDLKAGQIDLRRHMGVLHEEVLERIRALAFDPEPLRREFKADTAALRDELIARIEPLEAEARRRSRR